MLPSPPDPQVAVTSPLPGGLSAVVRFLFNLPAWLQITGFILGILVAAAVVWWLWRKRRPIVLWLASRPWGEKLALGGIAAAIVLLGSGGGAYGWHYMQHDNGFCTGCHVMGPAYQRFTQSKHDSLRCHQCHQQSLFASMRQLYLWVAERPAEIGPHAKVPNQVCAGCHVNGDPAKWKIISATAGHRTHLESDSSVLRGIQCVKCHGEEVHRFLPVDSTCGQAHCHVGVHIELGKMAQQTDLHCVTCHQFTAKVPQLATYDSAKGTLVPNVKQCFGCHQMRAMLASFDPTRDPHRGTCGMCHNPHVQARAADAAKTCTSAQCHSTWRNEPFHAGARHRAIAGPGNCLVCHQPHIWKVDPSDCAGCHAAVRARRAGGGKLAPPVPFDTTKAKAGISMRPPPEPLPKGKGDARLPDPPAPPVVAAPDSFPHAPHKSLACITCHSSQREHGLLTFQPPRGCQICHHQGADTATCARCHSADSLAHPESVTVRVAVANAPPREHAVRFSHATHQALRCVTCHTTAVSMDPAPETRACASCHESHHTANRACVVCHTDTASPAVRAAHAPPADAHGSCAACHTPAAVAGLVPDRGLCLSCHPSQTNHHPEQACAGCHRTGGAG
ncbi:MAG TPA: hypothetical protein VMC86_05645 [Gemmatimonadales bacterium]|nr:hypothetical protein [Gemmatimonadales bacterium]